MQYRSSGSSKYHCDLVRDSQLKQNPVSRNETLVYNIRVLPISTSLNSLHQLHNMDHLDYILHQSALFQPCSNPGIKINLT